MSFRKACFRAAGLIPAEHQRRGRNTSIDSTSSEWWRSFLTTFIGRTSGSGQQKAAGGDQPRRSKSQRRGISGLARPAFSTRLATRLAIAQNELGQTKDPDRLTGAIMPMCRGFLLLIVLSLPTLAASAAEEFGDISGQFVVEGPIAPRPLLVKAEPGAVRGVFKDVPDEAIVVDKATKGLANVFVYLRKAPPEGTPPLKRQAARDPEVVVTVKDYRFEPHAIFVRTDQKIRFRSGDRVPHNVHIYSLANPQQNFLLKARDEVGIAIDVKATETLPMPIKDDLHPWMRTTVLVLDHPYCGVTDKEGKFTIRGLPAGEHSFRVWHEAPGYINREWKVNVVGGKTTALPVVQVPPVKLERKPAPGPIPKPTI